MPGIADFVAAVDVFMATPKQLVGTDTRPVWQIGRQADQRKLVLPVEIEGEQRGQFLLLQAYPQHPTMKFSIGTMFADLVVCRLDYCLEDTHANNFATALEKLPPIVVGPHWHSWEANRGLITSLTKPLKLHNALPFTFAKQFDAIFRWYCATRNIKLDKHAISLPPRETLI
jgi:hypothetical protein